MQQYLRRLVAWPTVTTDKLVNRQALNWLQTMFNNIQLTVLESQGHSILWGSTRATKSPKLLLTAHLDVVPASPSFFQLSEQDGRWYGRGVIDMKFAIAAYLKLFQELGSELSTLDLGIMITTDEEVGGQNGVKYMLDNGYRAEFVFLPDGGGDWQVQQAAKGVCQLEATVVGKTAHGSRPWEGDPPVLPLIDFLKDLANLFRRNHVGHLNMLTIH